MSGDGGEQVLQKSKMRYVATIDEVELALRMCEATLRVKRQPGVDGVTALASMPADWGPAFLRASRTAMEYWSQCIDQSNKTN